MTEQQHCIGCGVPIQTTDENALGYTPTASLEKEVVYCKRCFRLRNYNELQPVSLTSDDFLRMLHRIGETSATILYLVDIFDFDGSWIHGLHRFVGNNPIILVGNKVDILPKSVKHRKVEMWMRRRSKQLGLHVQDVALISATKGNGLQELLESVQSQGQNKDVFVVGCTNVGKSTFIN
ncbi:MAG: ribosome biogenesis GTPase YqeH, partial [Bacilli bacterium]